MSTIHDHFNFYNYWWTGSKYFYTGCTDYYRSCDLGSKEEKIMQKQKKQMIVLVILLILLILAYIGVHFTVKTGRKGKCQRRGGKDPGDGS